jgi:hypothetical protein
LSKNAGSGSGFVKNQSGSTTLLVASVLEQLNFNCRDEGRPDVLCEMEKFEELGATFYAESGDLYKLIGVLRRHVLEPG